MSEGITINVTEVSTRGDETTVEMTGRKPSIMPDVVAKNRVRLKAIRVVGLEEFGRAAGESLLDGDIGRVTELVEYDSFPDGIVSDFNAVVTVRREM